jgi:uncharacterized protein (TIGR02646 family)
MKYLKHGGNEPRSLELRKKLPVVDATKAWDSYCSANKAQIHDALLPSQKHLCAYCEIELSRGKKELGYHIEHIELKSANAALTFEFTNLMLSCFDTGTELAATTSNPNPVSCGHSTGKKKIFDTKQFIKPTEMGCEQYFYYELDGTVVPNPTLSEPLAIQRADYTINLLNLNCRRLNRFIRTQKAPPQIAP